MDKSRISDEMREILTFFAAGYTRQQIVDTTQIALKTLDMYIADTYRILDVNNVTDALNEAWRQKLISSEDMFQKKSDLFPERTPEIIWEKFSALSDREKSVADATTHLGTHSAIAGHLNISVGTLSGSHLFRIYRKMGYAQTEENDPTNKVFSKKKGDSRLNQLRSDMKVLQLCKREDYYQALQTAEQSYYKTR